MQVGKLRYPCNVCNSYNSKLATYQLKLECLHAPLLNQFLLQCVTENNNNNNNRLVQKTVEKLTKYHDLKIEVDKTSSRTVPIIIGTLGAIPSDLLTYLSCLSSMVATMQKSVPLSTARSLRRHMKI